MNVRKWIVPAVATLGAAVALLWPKKQQPATVAQNDVPSSPPATVESVPQPPSGTSVFVAAVTNRPKVSLVATNVAPRPASAAPVRPPIQVPEHFDPTNPPLIQELFKKYPELLEREQQTRAVFERSSLPPSVLASRNITYDPSQTLTGSSSQRPAPGEVIFVRGDGDSGFFKYGAPADR